jgi:hypothetical protein
MGSPKAAQKVNDMEGEADHSVPFNPANET